TSLAHTLSRTSSATSISSDDTSTLPTGAIIARRTRKRFSSAQLAILENLFHQNSHPSREEREAVAQAGGMEVKSVTIWFQNKRQTERKVALNNNHNTTIGAANISRTTTTAGTRLVQAPCYSSRPSLDRIASRTEIRGSPHTPTRRRNPSLNLWDNMPSSPATSPTSPPSLEYVQFAKSQRVRRTLEWACAAARIAEKEGFNTAALAAPPLHSYTRRSRIRDYHYPHHHHHHHHQQYQHHPRYAKTDGNITEEETEEVVTPNGSWSAGDVPWVSHPESAAQVAIVERSKAHQGVPDEEVIHAALALCGLGRR
ncbi:hypothetical protein AMATHDRAFT_97237, partial [Amanita thiersii Skay4041]